MKRVQWTVYLEDGCVKVRHSQRGVICAGVLSADGQVRDIAFLDERNRMNNMIRMPAMSALMRWQEQQRKG